MRNASSADDVSDNAIDNDEFFMSNVSFPLRFAVASPLARLVFGLFTAEASQVALIHAGEYFWCTRGTIDARRSRE